MTGRHATEEERLYYATVALRLSNARQAAGLTQGDLSKLSGMSRSSIANIEAGRQHVLVNIMSKLATILGVEIGYLTGENDNDADITHMRVLLQEVIHTERRKIKMLEQLVRQHSAVDEALTEIRKLLK